MRRARGALTPAWALAAAVVVLALGGAVATHPGDPHACERWYRTDEYAGSVYLVREWGPYHEDAYWIYLETNGQPGVQRGGHLVLWHDDCVTSQTPDTLLY